MKHLSATRLLELCREALVQDDEEARHLQECPHCRALLLKHAEERGRANPLRHDDSDLSEIA